nr:MAG TPA: hypothetical protein [Bacteriophage sp.]
MVFRQIAQRFLNENHIKCRKYGIVRKIIQMRT